MINSRTGSLQLRRVGGFLSMVGALAVLVWWQPSVATGQNEDQFRTAFPLGALRNANASDAKVAASVLLKRIVHEQGYQYSTEIPETREIFFEGLRAGRYDFVLIEALDYLQLRDEVALVPRFAGAADEGDPQETFLLLVRQEVADQGFAKLEGGRLLFEQGGASLSRLWLKVEMAEQGLPDPDTFFAAVDEVSNGASAVLPVFFGKADACLVSKSGFETMVELNPQLGQRLAVLRHSEPLLISLMCLREGFVEKVPGQLDRVSSQLHEKPDGQQILNMMRVERLLLWEDRFVESVERLAARHRMAERAPLAGGAPASPITPLDTQGRVVEQNPESGDAITDAP